MGNTTLESTPVSTCCSMLESTTRSTHMSTSVSSTVVAATGGHFRFGAKVAPRGRERKFMTSSQKQT